MTPFNYLPKVILPVLVVLCSTAIADNSRQQLLDRLALLEKLDRADFLNGLEEANQCTGKRNFSCADNGLQRIKPLLRNADDEKLFALAMQNLQREKNQVAEENRLQREAEQLAARERQRLIDAEEAEERRQQRAAAEEEKRRAIQYGINSVAIAAASKNLDRGQLNTLMEANARDYQEGGNGRNLQASFDKLKADNERRFQENQQKIREQQAERRREQAAVQRALEEQRVKEAQRQQQTVAAQRVAQEQATQQATQQRQQAEEKKRQEAERIQKEQERQKQAALVAAEKEREAAEQLKEKERKEQERQQKLVQEKAEREAKKAAEKAEKERAEAQYLEESARTIRMKARTCPGGYYLFGDRKRISPEVVACIDVHYSLRCPGGRGAYERGVAKNFVGMNMGCLGDTYQISKPSCNVDEVIVDIDKAVPCSFGK